MNNVLVLDCTLRDGGYCNQWKFGANNIAVIMKGLKDANIDIVECGFLSNRVAPDENNTRFSSLADVSKRIPREKEGSLYVVMINYGEYRIDDIPYRDQTTVDGIRVAFHKEDVAQALLFCEQIKAKGYLLFIQPMVSLCYTVGEFQAMIARVNQIRPYAFYIVDSFGSMKRNDLRRFAQIVEKNLDGDSKMGFHSHNNMQLSYAHAQMLMDMDLAHDLVIDSSIYGMGRGAGNLNTELFIDYLNMKYGTKYVQRPLLTIMDHVLGNFYSQEPWGYSLPNFLSAAYNCHPNYASYLTNKNTLEIENIDRIFSMMKEVKKKNFDEKYIESLYIEYMDMKHVHKKRYEEFMENVRTHRVLIVAPGASSEADHRMIGDFCDGDTLAISVNFDYQYIADKYIFVSNLRRYHSLENKEGKRLITTSNIPAEKPYLQIRYYDLLNDYPAVRDNAGLMLIKLLAGIGAKQIHLAGFDGYSYETSENYMNESLILQTKKSMIDDINHEMSVVLRELTAASDIRFLTKPVHVHI